MTMLPLRPGESEPLGIDINADRASHRRFNSDPLCVPSEPDRQAGGGRRPRRQDREEVAPRKSPERKQVSAASNAHQLHYDIFDSEGAGYTNATNDLQHRQGRRRVEAPANAAGTQIGSQPQTGQPLYQPLIAHKQAIFEKEIVKPVTIEIQPAGSRGVQGRPHSANYYGREQQQQRHVCLEVDSAPISRAQEAEFAFPRPRRRPGTATAPRTVAALAVVDSNAERKAKLLEKWGAVCDDDNLPGGGLLLPSVRANYQHQQQAARPRSAMPLRAQPQRQWQADLPEEHESNARARLREREQEQYQDIMHNCREIADKNRHPLHRRLKSDVTNLKYVLPPPPRSSEVAAQVVVPGPQVPPPASQDPTHPPRSKVERLRGSVEGLRFVDVDGRPLRSAEPPMVINGLPQEEHRASRSKPEIVLRGAGQHGDGELLPSQRRGKQDTAQNIISGLL